MAAIDASTTTPLRHSPSLPNMPTRSSSGSPSPSVSPINLPNAGIPIVERPATPGPALKIPSSASATAQDRLRGGTGKCELMTPPLTPSTSFDSTASDRTSTTATTNNSNDGRDVLEVCDEVDGLKLSVSAGPVRPFLLPFRAPIC